jgi:hypothetical protein
MVHPVLATGPRLGRLMGIEGRGELGRLSGVMSPWDAQRKGVGWAVVGFTGPHAGEEARLGLGHVKIEKKGGKEEAGRAGLGSQLSFGPRPFRD